MEEERIELGEMKLEISGPPLHRPMSDDERNAIAEDVLKQITERLDDAFPGIRFELTLLQAELGCIKVKLGLAIIIFAYTAAYNNKLLVSIEKKIRSWTAYECPAIDGGRQPCKVVVKRNDLTLPPRSGR